MKCFNNCSQWNKTFTGHIKSDMLASESIGIYFAHPNRVISQIFYRVLPSRIVLLVKRFGWVEQIITCRFRSSMSSLMFYGSFISLEAVIKTFHENASFVSVRTISRIPWLKPENTVISRSRYISSGRVVFSSFFFPTTFYISRTSW